MFVSTNNKTPRDLQGSIESITTNTHIDTFHDTSNVNIHIYEDREFLRSTRDELLALDLLELRSRIYPAEGIAPHCFA